MSAVLESEAIAGLTAADFTAHMARSATLPTWWLEAKKTAWNRYLATPLPKRNDERWRFSNVSALNLDWLKYSPAKSEASVGLPNFPRVAELAFVNGEVVKQTEIPATLREKGVIFCSLEDALLKHGELLQKFFQRHSADLGSEKFAALNTALTTTGAFLYVPRGVEITEVFAVQHSVAGENNSVFPHTIVALEDQAKATLVEFFVSQDESGRQFASGVNDLYAATGAQLTYIGAQRWTPEALSFQSNSIVADRDARVLSLNLHLGGKQARHESHSRLRGPGAHSEMLALTVAENEQEFDQRTLQTHQAPHTSSNLLYKNVLLDKAKTIFSGLIIVEPEAQKTDAYQSNRNLMLSDEAEANSLPGLEIQANDVRCTHGATTARIDREQEFYLRARGIHPAQAHELLVFGFFEEVLAKLENEALHDALRTFIESKFA